MTTETFKSEVQQAVPAAPSSKPVLDYYWHGDAPPPELRLPTHIPALDGIRGIAVLLVLFCHATQRPFGAEAATINFASAIDRGILSIARLSWTGVDLFFVLSGFLITGILFDAKGKDHYFRNFYARRTVRIFPLYYISLVIFLIIFPAMPAWFNYTAAGLPRWGNIYSAQPWYWFYLSNYAQGWTEQHGYITDHILHVSWSLAIEEQFYICWPLVCFLCTRRTLIRVCVGMFFGSMALRAGLNHFGLWNLAMSFTPCRVDGLATGAMIALVARGPKGIRSLIKPALVIGPLSAVGLGAVIVIMQKMGFRRGIGQSPGYVIVGTSLFALLYGSMLVLAASASKGSRVNRFFAHPLLRIYGKYSYAIYLFHLPLMILIAEKIFFPAHLQIGKSILPGLLVFYLITFAVSLGVGVLSWNLIEKHFLRLKDYFPMGGGHAA